MPDSTGGDAGAEEATAVASAAAPAAAAAVDTEARPAALLPFSDAAAGRGVVLLNDGGIW
jgi:hypothetical protein